jgi:hypothetical protein
MAGIQAFIALLRNGNKEGMSGKEGSANDNKLALYV